MFTRRLRFRLSHCLLETGRREKKRKKKRKLKVDTYLLSSGCPELTSVSVKFQRRINPFPIILSRRHNKKKRKSIRLYLKYRIVDRNFLFVLFCFLFVWCRTVVGVIVSAKPFVWFFIKGSYDLETWSQDFLESS